MTTIRLRQSLQVRSSEAAKEYDHSRRTQCEGVFHRRSSKWRRNQKFGWNFKVWTVRGAPSTWGSHSSTAPGICPCGCNFAGSIGLQQRRRSQTRGSVDISGSGIALYLPRQVILLQGLMVEKKFTLPQGDFPVDKSVVIRVSERNEKGIAVGSFQFVNMKESVRQRVIQYTFSRQRALM